MTLFVAGAKWRGGYINLQASSGLWFGIMAAANTNHICHLLIMRLNSVVYVHLNLSAPLATSALPPKSPHSPRLTSDGLVRDHALSLRNSRTELSAFTHTLFQD